MNKFSLLAIAFLLVFSLEAFAADQVTFNLRSGRSITATIKAPDTARGKLPVLMVFGGFKEAARVLELVKTQEPIILAGFDYPFDPPRKFMFPASLRYAPQVKQMIADTREGILELRKVLIARGDVDASKITIIGASLGSPFAIAAAAEDPGFSGLVLVHGFADLRRTSKHQFIRSWKPKFGFISHVPAWLITTFGYFYLNPPEPEEAAWALHRNQKVLVIEATEDSFIPKKSREALWDGLQKSAASVEKIEMPGDHVQPGSEQAIENILGLVNIWMIKVGLL